MTTDDVRKAALNDLAERDDDEPCRAVHAVAVLDALGFDDHDVREVGAWRKLMHETTCGEAREWTKRAREAKPEERQHMLTEHAKRKRA